LAIEPQKPLLVAAPGEFVTQVFSLSYEGAAPEPIISRELTLKAPSDWQVLGLDEINPVTLKPGESRQIFVTIGVPPLYPAEEYRLSLRPSLKLEVVVKPLEQSPSTEVRAQPTVAVTVGSIKQGDFTVRVKRAAIPKVEPRSPRAEVDPGWMPAAVIRFVVLNQGNVRGTFKLRAIPPTGWRILPYRKQVELGPGESEEVSIGLIVPEETSAGVGEVILRALAKGYQSEAAVKVTVLPR